MSFNACDPTGAAGLYADSLAIASVGAHALPVVTGAYARDTGEVFDHHAMDEEAVMAQARSVLEDVAVQVIKVGFAGSAEILAVIAELAADYEDIPVVAYMPDLSWWDDAHIDNYLDAYRDLVLPQATLLVGNYGTLCRWLLPDWSAQRNPEPRDLARAAEEKGAPYTLITGMPLPEQWIDNVLASPHEVISRRKFERREAAFFGAGDTLSATLAALLASGADLGTAANEALSYLDQCLDGAFLPGMGRLVPDRLFWAQPESLASELHDTELDLEPDDLTEITPHEPSHITKH